MCEHKENGRNGRMQDVFIEEIREIGNLIVWADKGNRDIILSVEGVCIVNTISPTMYSVVCDKRYDIEYLMEEIEAAIKCGGFKEE